MALPVPCISPTRGPRITCPTHYVHVLAIRCTACRLGNQDLLLLGTVKLNLGYPPLDSSPVPAAPPVRSDPGSALRGPRGSRRHDRFPSRAPFPRRSRTDRMDAEGNWGQPRRLRDAPVTDTFSAAGDVGSPTTLVAVPTARIAPESAGPRFEHSCVIVRAEWTGQQNGSDTETSGSITAVLEFRRRGEDR